MKISVSIHSLRILYSCIHKYTVRTEEQDQDQDQDKDQDKNKIKKEEQNIKFNAYLLKIELKSH